MAKKVLFINSPAQEGCDQFFGWPTSLLYAISPTVAATRNGELDVEFVPEIFNPQYFAKETRDKVENNFDALISSQKPDVVCASATYDSIYPALLFFQRAKRVNPKIVTVLGGPHFDEVHNLPHFNDVLLSPEVIDIGIGGDGEFALKAVLESLNRERDLSSMDWESIDGKTEVYTKSGEVYRTNGRKISLENCPVMPIEFVNRVSHEDRLRVFQTAKGNSLRVVEMVASRGCPYSCLCCSEGKELAYPNSKSVESIVEEVYLRKGQGFGAVFFDDSTFGTHPKLTALLDELGKTGMQFGSLNRFDHLKDRKLVEKYRNAGFSYFYCAIEQFDDDVLKNMNKSQGEQSIKDSMHLLHDFGFKLGVSLIYGLSNETGKSIAKTMEITGEFVDNGTIHLVSESILSYHPGTALGRALQEGFHRTPPNPGYPFNQFKEGQWYHPPYVNAKYLEKILKLSESKFGKRMIKKGHGWFSV